MSVWIITPTGGRPRALSLLGEYINGQTYKGEINWVIVDDCDPQSRVPTARPGVNVTVIRPSWRWKAGMNTQAACTTAALEAVPDDAVLFCCEDDDAYLPEYIGTMLAALDSYDLVGEHVSRYYNVRTRKFKELVGEYHSSLACTAMCGSAVSVLRDVCKDKNRYIDMTLWKLFKGSKMLVETQNVIGIKGMPGRGGIGVGHRGHFGSPDLDGSVLKSWLGEFASAYEQL